MFKYAKGVEFRVTDKDREHALKRAKERARQVIKQERQSSKRKIARAKAKMKRDEVKHQETLTIIKLQADGFTQRQISEQLGISLGTVNNRLKGTRRTE